MTQSNSTSPPHATRLRLRPRSAGTVTVLTVVCIVLPPALTIALLLPSAATATAAASRPPAADLALAADAVDAAIRDFDDKTIQVETPTGRQTLHVAGQRRLHELPNGRDQLFLIDGLAYAILTLRYLNHLPDLRPSSPPQMPTGSQQTGRHHGGQHDVDLTRRPRRG
jgi:hypothetical protein